MIVAPASAPVFRSPRAAHGLLVPGSGATVSREGALAALLRGELGNANVRGGLSAGKELIRLASGPGRITFYVSLPAPGKHANDRRYPLAVVGPGWLGLLESPTTRLDGLVSIADVAPSVRSLARGERPRIHATQHDAPLEPLAELNRRLEDAHAARRPADVVLACLVLALAAFAIATRAGRLARAALLAAPATVLTSILLSGAGASTPWLAVPLLAVVSAATALAGGLVRPALVPLAAVLLAIFALLWTRPEWNALGLIGPHPAAGGRFYGLTNQVETLMLAPALALGALAGARALPGVALLVAAAVGAGRLGADGGGLIVYLVGFLALAVRLYRVPALRAAAATGIAAAGALALVAVDAVTGGSSHVSDALGGGPGGLFHDFMRRLELSAEAVVASPQAAIFTVIGLAALVWFALRRPRLELLDAYLVAVAVSLAVNDTPNDIAGYGSLCALALWAYLRTEKTPAPLQ